MRSEQARLRGFSQDSRGEKGGWVGPQDRGELSVPTEPRTPLAEGKSPPPPPGHRRGEGAERVEGRRESRSGTWRRQRRRNVSEDERREVDREGPGQGQRCCGQGTRLCHRLGRAWGSQGINFGGSGSSWSSSGSLQTQEGPSRAPFHLRRPPLPSYLFLIVPLPLSPLFVLFVPGFLSFPLGSLSSGDLSHIPPCASLLSEVEGHPGGSGAAGELAVPEPRERARGGAASPPGRRGRARAAGLR